jgi:hypothetical protein
MQRRSRGVLLALVAVFAMSAVTAAVASATTPEFKPVPTKKKFTDTSGSVLFRFDNGSETMTCTKSSATGGEITGAGTVGGLVVKFTSCKTTGATGEGCAVKSTNTKTEGEILTNSLTGELGTVAIEPKLGEHLSWTALLLKPTSGTTWTTLAANKCTKETLVTGDLAPEVSVIGKKQATNKLVFSATTGKALGEEITLHSGKTAEVKGLTAWTTNLQFETTDELAFEEAVEIT